MNIIEKFVIRQYSKETSRKTTTARLKKFFNFLEQDPNTYINCDVRRLSNDDKIDLFDSIEDDILRYAQLIEKDPPKSQITYLSSLKKFLEYQYVDLPNRFWDSLKTRNQLVNPQPTAEKKTPSPSELELILQYGDIRSKAFFLLKAHSGMRIDELCSLRMKDINIDEREIRVRDYKSKGGYNRYTSFTKESQDYLKKWVKERKRYLTTGLKRSSLLREKLDLVALALNSLYLLTRVTKGLFEMVYII